MRTMKRSLSSSKQCTSITSHMSTDSSQVTAGSSRAGDFYKRSKAVWVGRLVFISCLMIVAGIFGYFSYYYLHASETDLVENQYRIMVDRGRAESKRIAENKFLGADTMAKVVAHSFPDPEVWPFVYVPGYWDIAASVVPTSIVGGLSLAPIVQPGGEEQAKFEEMAYAVYEENFPGQDAGISSFGKGIWVKDDSVNTADTHYHDITGNTTWGSPYNFLVPKFQHSQGVHPLLMMNVHGFEQQGLAVDATYECSFKRAFSEHPESIRCTSVSDLVPPKDPTDVTGPGAFVTTAIYPANAPTQLTGFIFAKVNWNEVLDSVFPKEVNGIDCVVSTQSQVFTYTVVDGSVISKGEGDLHDPKYDEYEISDSLLNTTTFSEKSVGYTISFYPNDDFDDLYRTKIPLAATLGAVLIIIFTSAMFFFYDFIVRREVSQKKQLLEAKRQFVRFVSHEVRTPLNSVCMGLTLLQEEIGLALGSKNETLSQDEVECSPKSSVVDPGWYELTQEIQAGALSSVDVLNDLLNYDKIESGTLSLELTLIPIWKLVKSTVNEFRLPAATKCIDLGLNMPSEISDAKTLDAQSADPDICNQKVVGDSVRITQVIRNLVSNALKFTPEGKNVFIETKWNKLDPNSRVGRLSRVFVLKNGDRISVKTTGELIVTVADDGAGMSKEQLSNLFRQGVQFNVNELQAGQGSGLGLYIAKGIVEQHGGSLSAESRGIGCGTTFTLKIPVYDIPEVARTTTESDTEKTLETEFPYSLKPLRVLIVDDASSNRKLLNRLLTNRGHDCEEAENGELAVEMIKNTENTLHQYDMVLMDYEMPVMNGPTAAGKIRELGSDVFMIGITGNTMAEDLEFYQACGANAVIAKPFKVSNLEDICVEYQVTSRRHVLEGSHSTVL